MKYILTLAICATMAIPFLVSAQAGGLVPCSGPECNTCHVVAMANNVMNWLITFLSVIAVIGFVISGFQLVTSQGNPGAMSAAKARFTNVVIGIVLVLASWLIVDTLMLGLTGTGMEIWGTVECKASQIETDSTGNNPGADQSTNFPGTTGCPTCAKVNGIACKSENSCTVSSEYAMKLNELSANSGESLLITEAYPPTRVHQATCHTNGTCTDIVFSDRNFTPERITAFQQAAAQSGMRAVYEPGPGGSCSGITNCLPNSTTKSSGDHFSLYMN